MTIRGTTELIAHIGFPTTTFKSPLIYNPYFEHAGIDAVVVPMGCHYEHFPAVLAAVFMLTNVRGALIAMPHKVTAATVIDEASPAVRAAGSCNAVRRTKDGRLQGDLFDGEGFVRALRRNGCNPAGASALVVGAGGAGSAIGASLAAAGVRTIALFDVHGERARESGESPGNARIRPLAPTWRFEPSRRPRHRGERDTDGHDPRTIRYRSTSIAWTMARGSATSSCAPR